MDIIFEKLNPTAEEREEYGIGKPEYFDQWLQGFAELDESLLLEIDLENDLFIAKSFIPDKTVVKYGQISFKKCGFGVIGINNAEGHNISLTEWNEAHPGRRVYVGLLHTLKRFIQTVNFFNTEDTFKMIVRFDETNIDNIGSVYMASKVEFKSVSMSMIARGYNLTEFNAMLLDDARFNKIAEIKDPVQYEYGADMHNRILNGTQINSTDPKKDIIYFEITPSDGSYALSAHDQNREYYDYRISTNVVDGEPKEAASPVTRSNYITANKGYKADKYIMTVSAANVANGRIKIETGDKAFVTVIANVRTAQ